MWREGSCRSFTVNQKGSLLPIHHVLFDLSDVVRDIIDDVHVQVVGRGAEDFGEGLKCEPECEAEVLSSLEMKENQR